MASRSVLARRAATLAGDPVRGASSFCFLFGSTMAFTDDQLVDLHRTRAEYLEAFGDSADAAVEEGFLLRAGADAMVADAELLEWPS